MRQANSISIAELLAHPEQFDTIIDVRAPSEFLHDHIPGAVSHPVLSDNERAEIGTLHKQASGFVAKRRGAVLVARNVADALERHFNDKPANWRPVIYCWRGGQRSNSMATIFSRIGWDATVLHGGYKTFRAQVLRELDTLPLSLQWKVLCGRTGTGKSEILRALRAGGEQVLDLEELAVHRGSVLGHWPGEVQPAQKWFESQLYAQLRSFSPDRPVYVESESKKIGAVQVPQVLMECMRASPCIEIRAPISARVPLLQAQYEYFIADTNGKARLHQQLDCLTALHGGQTIAYWKDLADTSQWDDFVAQMLQQHYDPAYDKSIGKNFAQYSSALVLETDQLDSSAIQTICQEILSASASA